MKIIQGITTKRGLSPHELKDHIGSEVTLWGTVYSLRVMKGFAFVQLAVEEGYVQCLYSPEFSRFPLESIQENMSLRALGEVVADARSTIGCEVHLREVEILSQPEGPTPVAIHHKEMMASLETLLNYRPITLRNAREKAIFKVQSALCQGFHSFFAGEGFTEIHTPKIVAGTAEGGANVFALNYFGEQAFLTQSPQLYKQMMVGVYPRVYEIGPVFRAEKHDTSRHVNEYTSVDMEMGFIHSMEDVMEVETRMLRETLAGLKGRCEEELSLLSAELPQVDAIPAVTFTEAKAMIEKVRGAASGDDGDLEPEEERILSRLAKETWNSEFLFVTHYPQEKRPFYAMDSEKAPGYTESFDLLFRGLEITTGGQRIHDYQTQLAKMAARGMETSPFKSYLMAHRYGLPPHGGFGLGLERLTAQLLGLSNIRQGTLFPRDTHRLRP